MRPLTEEETKAVFESELVDVAAHSELTPQSSPTTSAKTSSTSLTETRTMRTASVCIRTSELLSLLGGVELMRRVYYLPLPILHLATSIARPNLVSMGTCFGKFSKSGKFKLGVTCLDWIAQYAKYKVSW